MNFDSSANSEISTYIAMQRNRFDVLSRMLSHTSPYPLELVREHKGNTEDRVFSLIVRINSNTERLDKYVFQCEDASGIGYITVEKEHLQKKKGLMDMVKFAMEGTVVSLNFESLLRRKNLISITFAGDELLESRSNWPELETKGELAIMSDVHVGSLLFKQKEFTNALLWMNDRPNVSDLIIAGDLIDGAGVFPNQNNELSLQTCHEQYYAAADLLNKLRKSITVHILPGNHDATIRAHPQPQLPKVYSDLFGSNVRFYANPALLDIGGRRVLAYHGQSMDQLISKIQYLTYPRPQRTMEYLLKIRHLSPVMGRNGNTLWTKEDPLIVEQKPWLFITGHIHTMTNTCLDCGTLLVNSGAWQGLSSFQARLGLVPEICKLTVVPFRDNRLSYTIDFLGEGSL